MTAEQQQDEAAGRDIADLLSDENLDAHRISASIVAAVRELREQLAAATARAEKAEAERQRERTARQLDDRHIDRTLALLLMRFGGAVEFSLSEVESAPQRGEFVCMRNLTTGGTRLAFQAADAVAADAARDGLSATETDADGSQASADGNSSSITPQDLSEPEPPRDPSAWCWAPNPAGRLHCGRLRDHEPPHRRGERTWTGDDTTEAGDE